MIKRKAGLLSLMGVMIILAVIFLSGTALAGNESKNVATVIQYLDDVMHDKVYEAIEEYIHPEEYTLRYLHVEGFHDDVSHGHSEHKEYIKAMHETVPDLSLTIKDIAAEGDIVFTHVNSEGTLSSKTATGEWTGNTFHFDSIIMWRFKEGKIVEQIIAYNEEHAVAQQSGKTKPKSTLAGTPLVHIGAVSGTNNVSANVAKAVEFIEAYEENDIESIEVHFHDSYGHATHPNDTMEGEALLAAMKEERNFFKDLNFKILNIAADGDVVFIHWVQTATVINHGGLYNIEGMTLTKFKDGKVCETVTHIDTGEWEDQVFPEK